MAPEAREQPDLGGNSSLSAAFSKLFQSNPICSVFALGVSSLAAISPASKRFEGFLVMASQRTLSIIKPDATERNITGLIVARLEGAGLRVIAQKRVWWKKKDARKFYDIHKDQPFFKDLVNFMTSGPIVLQVLEGEDAIAKNREVMGATNPVDAAPGSIRKDFAVNLQRNSVHGSDSPETAKREIALCFKKSEIVG
jgi:nucleoside-diphosphate kinase